MTPQSSVDAVQEIVAEMQYLLGVEEEEDFAYSATPLPTPLPNPLSKALVSK